MNPKLLIGFLAGVIAASGVGYYLAHRQAGEPSPVAAVSASATPGSTPEPAATPAPAPGTPTSPVAAQPEKKPAHVTKPVVATSRVASSLTKPAPGADWTPAPTRPVETASVNPPATAVAPAPAPVENPVENRLEPKVEARPEPPQPHTVTIAAGTLINVRLGEGLSTERNKPGDVFTATLDQPLVADGFAIAERGAHVLGRVVESDQAGRVKGLARLTIELTQISTSDNQKIPIRTAQFEKQGPESKGEDAAKVGLGAVLGTIIGAAAGGGKGAAIGAGAGAAAGGGTVAATRGKPSVLPVETRISFRLDQPVTITEQLRN